jgi:hypothetical protein
MTNPKIAPWQAVFRTIVESGYTKETQKKPEELKKSGCSAAQNLNLKIKDFDRRSVEE